MDLLKTKINLVKYLDKVNDLKYIEEKALAYKADFLNNNSDYFPPLRISLAINFSILAEIVGNNDLFFHQCLERMG